jgi:hypothetical protein
MAGVAAGVGAAASAASAGSSIAKGAGGASSKPTQAQFNDYMLRYAGEQLWDQPQFQAPDLSTTPYQGYKWLQDFTPETYQPWIGQVSQMSDDQASLDAQRAALAQEQQWARGGLTPTDMQTLAAIQQQQAGAASSAAATSADALRQRGLGGAGQEYAAMLAANQGASNNAQQFYGNAMQTALQRQLQATQNAGSLAGGIRQQSDAVSQAMANINNQFNSQVQQLRTNAAMNAAQTRNAAQAANLAGRQGVANENVDITNQNADLTRQIQQQNYNNRLQWLSGKTNAMNGVANYFGALDAAQGQQRQGAQQSMMNGLNQLANAGKQIAGNTNVGDWLHNQFNGTGSFGGSNDAANYGSGGGGTWDDGTTGTLVYGNEPQPIDSGSFDLP